MASRYPSKLPDRELDDGTLRVTAVHVGDGYYSVTCTCDVWGADATKTWTAPKAQGQGHRRRLVPGALPHAVELKGKLPPPDPALPTGPPDD
jgi:hypothetical protein